MSPWAKFICDLFPKGPNYQPQPAPPDAEDDIDVEDLAVEDPQEENDPDHSDETSEGVTAAQPEEERVQEASASDSEPDEDASAMAQLSTFIVKPNGAKLEMGNLTEDMAAEDVLTLAKASAARQGNAEIALGVVDQEKVENETGERNIYL